MLRALLPGGSGEAELRPITGREEEWLAHNAAAPCAVAVTELLGSCIVSLFGKQAEPDVARNLLVGDRDYLMLQLRRATIGERFSAIVSCPECGQKIDVEFDVDNIPIERRPAQATTYQLSSGGRTVCFRLPTGADQEAVCRLDLSAAEQELLARCVLDDGGIVLSAQEREAVISAMDQAAPQINLELDITCPECSGSSVVPFDSSAFFLHEMRLRADQLLKEIHLLALYYHWSEADILGLTRLRRRAYLDLLSDATRRL